MFFNEETSELGGMVQACVILVLKKLRQKNHKFRAILGFIVRPCQQNKRTKECETLDNVGLSFFTFVPRPERIAI